MPMGDVPGRGKNDPGSKCQKKRFYGMESSCGSGSMGAAVISPTEKKMAHMCMNFTSRVASD